MKITKISENQYEIGDGEHKILFSKEKFEDLYYAVPLNQTAFLRLLLDNICENNEQRHIVNTMLDKTGERSALLEDLQQQIQNIEYEGE